MLAAPRAELPAVTSAPTVFGARRSRRRVAVAALAVVALASGCGGAATPVTQGEGPGPTSAATDPPGSAPDALTAPSVTAPSGTASSGAASSVPGRQPLPSVIVNDVAAGTKIDLASVPPPDRPLLIWFWAPH